jgi:hypothetical protein
MTGAKGRWPEPDLDRGVEDVTLLILEWLGEQGVGAVYSVERRHGSCTAAETA